MLDIGGLFCVYEVIPGRIGYRNKRVLRDALFVFISCQGILLVGYRIVVSFPGLGSFPVALDGSSAFGESLEQEFVGIKSSYRIVTWGNRLVHTTRNNPIAVHQPGEGL